MVDKKVFIYGHRFNISETAMYRENAINFELLYERGHYSAEDRVKYYKYLISVLADEKEILEIKNRVGI
jgi:hypothetical protein